MIPCDLLITKNQRVFINGHEIGMVMGIDLNAEPNSLVEVTIRLFPTSVVYGDPPTESIGETYTDQSGQQRVDINKAIENAKKRLAKKP